MNPQAQLYPPAYGDMGNAVPLTVKPDDCEILRNNIMHKIAPVNNECHDDAIKYLSRITEVEKRMSTNCNEIAQSIQTMKINKVNFLNRTFLVAKAKLQGK